MANNQLVFRQGTRRRGERVNEVSKQLGDKGGPEMRNPTQCECVGVHCGAHPLGLCAKSPVKPYEPGGTADATLVRWFCDACAAGLKSKPKIFRERKKRTAAAGEDR